MDFFLITSFLAQQPLIIDEEVSEDLPGGPVSTVSPTGCVSHRAASL